MTDDRQLVRDPRIFRSLQYFESVARHGSIKDAAAENRVSASAVSHQLRELRNFLGEEILVRSGRTVKLTPTGEQLYEQVSRVFADLDRTLGKTVGERREIIRIAVCSSFGPAWLARRLTDLKDHLPSVDVELRMFTLEPLQSEKTADVVVTADDVAPGFEAVTLFEEMLVAVMGPETALDRKGRPLHLITTDIESHNLADDWQEFGAVSGDDYLGAAEGPPTRCTHYLLPPV